MDSNSKPLVSNHETTEESTWTMYFDDFYNNNNEDQYNNDDTCSHDHAPSFISDAASSVRVKKIANDYENDKNFKKWIGHSKKRRSTGGVHVVCKELEDTASSPSNSPKVYSLMDHNPSQKYIKEMTQGKGGTWSKQVNERSEMKFDISGGYDDCTDLKKKGLCLVPLSMATNFIG